MNVRSAYDRYAEWRDSRETARAVTDGVQAWLVLAAILIATGLAPMIAIPAAGVTGVLVAIASHYSPRR